MEHLLHPNHCSTVLNNIKMLIIHLQNSNSMWFNLILVEFDPNNSFTKQLLLMLFFKRGNWSLARLYNMHMVKQSISGVLFSFSQGNSSSLWTGDYDEVIWHFYCSQWWRFWVCYFTDFIQYIDICCVCESYIFNLWRKSEVGN